MWKYERTNIPIDYKYRSRLRYEADGDDAKLAKTLCISRIALARAVAGFPIQKALREYLMAWCEQSLETGIPLAPNSGNVEAENREKAAAQVAANAAAFESKRRIALRIERRAGIKP